MDAFTPALKIVVGGALVVLGFSFIYKAQLAALQGRVRFWTGLEHFGFLFVPITILTPFFTHLPSSEKSLIVDRRSLYNHLLYGPLFLLVALMCITSGADLVGLPGARIMNTILTFGRQTMPYTDPTTGVRREVPIPPAVVYTPPVGDSWIGSYKFPLIKRARLTVFRTLTTKINFNKSSSLNSFERNGSVDVDQFTNNGQNLNAEEDDSPI